MAERDYTFDAPLTEDDIKECKGIRVGGFPGEVVEEGVPPKEYLYYIRALKRIKFGEPIPDTTFTDVKSPVLRQRLVKAICLKKVQSTT